MHAEDEANFEELYGGFYNSPQWRELRYKAFKKYGRKCACCGATAKDTRLHADHIKPRSNYPELQLELSNLQILCEDCNLGKSNTDEISWEHIDAEKNMVMRDLLDDIREWGIAEGDGSAMHKQARKEIHERLDEILDEE